MYILGKNASLKMGDILASSYYQEWVGFFREILEKSRDKKNRTKPDFILSIQLRLAMTESGFWKVLKEGREKAGALNAKQKKSTLMSVEKEELKGYERQIGIHEQLIRISRTIMDGIAWRTIGYNRTFLNSSSRGFGAGDIDIDGKSFKAEFGWAHKISKEFKSVVILNDLTRFLRVGDLTEIRGKTPILHEVKKNGKVINNVFTLKTKKNLSQQDRRLLELQRIAVKNEAYIDGQWVPTRTSSILLKTHLSEVEHLIERSKKEVVAHLEIESFLTIEVLNFPAMHEKKLKLDKIKRKSYKIPKKGMNLITTNWDTFYADSQGNFVRSGVPFSIFPYSDADCINLMSGNYLVKSVFDIEKLKNALTAKGYQIEDPKELDFDTQIAAFEKSKAKMFSKEKQLYGDPIEEAGIFTIRKGAFSLKMTSAVYSRMISEFMTFKTFLKLLDEMHAVAKVKKKDQTYFSNFPNEKNVWN